MVLLQAEGQASAQCAKLEQQLRQWRERAAQLQLQLVTQEESFGQQLEQVGQQEPCIR